MPESSPTGKYNTFITLLFVLFVTAVKEAYEDYKRWVADVQENNRQVKANRGGEWIVVTWKDIAVGDMVRVEDKEEFPADLVLLSSNLPEGMCYIESANLDGEVRPSVITIMHDLPPAP